MGQTLTRSVNAFIDLVADELCHNCCSCIAPLCCSLQLVPYYFILFGALGGSVTNC